MIAFFKIGSVSQCLMMLKSFPVLAVLAAGSRATPATSQVSNPARWPRKNIKNQIQTDLNSQGGHTSSAHSSTGPSNNTGSTGLSNPQWPQGFPPGARPPHFSTGPHRGPHHFPTPPRATGTPVQYPTAPGTPQFGPGGGQGAQVPQFPPHAQFGGPGTHYQGGGHYQGGSQGGSHCGTPSIASLQMV